MKLCVVYISQASYIQEKCKIYIHLFFKKSKSGSVEIHIIINCTIILSENDMLRFNENTTLKMHICTQL